VWDLKTSLGERGLGGDKGQMRTGGHEPLLGKKPSDPIYKVPGKEGKGESGNKITTKKTNE